tara:strand:- start:3167 stop:3277 length:111 start_codon:yes stop_codon:yes gene_type:complete
MASSVTVMEANKKAAQGGFWSGSLFYEPWQGKVSVR